jgi:hypothetical protein
MNLFYSKINPSFNNTIKTEIYGLKNKWKKDLNNVKALTSGFNPNYLFFNILHKQLLDKLYQNTGTQYKVSCWWANFYKPNHFAVCHSHRPENISCIVFIKSSKDNPLYFIDNNYKYKIYESDELVLFFDSSTPHAVDICKEERITLAVDFVKSI